MTERLGTINSVNHEMRKLHEGHREEEGRPLHGQTGSLVAYRVLNRDCPPGDGVSPSGFMFFAVPTIV